MPSDIAATDVEEQKEDESENRKIEMKLQFQENLQTYRTYLMKRKAKFVE